MDYFRAFQDYVKSENIDKKQALFFNGKATTMGKCLRRPVASPPL